MRYIKRYPRISKKQKVFSERERILEKSALTSDEILELFGNNDKIIKSEVIIDDNNLYAYFLLDGGFVVNQKDLVSIQPQLPDYIPSKERNKLLEGLNGAKNSSIDATEYDVVEVVFECRDDKEKTFYESGKEITLIGGTQKFIASRFYVTRYYDIIMTGYIGYKTNWEKEETILEIAGLPHYDVAVYIKFIGDILEKAVYKPPQEDDLNIE